MEMSFNRKVMMNWIIFMMKNNREKAGADTKCSTAEYRIFYIT